MDPQQRKYVSPNEFKKRFKKYCLFKGYVFNPQMYDSITGKPLKYDQDGHPITDYKSGGIEYFAVGTTPFTQSNTPTTQNTTSKP